MAAGDFRITRGALLLASGRALPPLEQILVSHALIHTRTANLFREGLARPVLAVGHSGGGHPEKELFATASATLGIQEHA